MKIKKTSFQVFTLSFALFACILFLPRASSAQNSGVNPTILSAMPPTENTNIRLFVRMLTNDGSLPNNAVDLFIENNGTSDVIQAQAERSNHTPTMAIMFVIDDTLRDGTICPRSSSRSRPRSSSRHHEVLFNAMEPLLAAGELVGIYVLDENARRTTRKVLAPTNNRTDIENFLNEQIDCNGQESPITSAINSTIEILERDHLPAHREIILISDGVSEECDNESCLNGLFSETINNANEAGISISVLAVNRREAVEDLTRIQNLAEETGGMHIENNFQTSSVYQASLVEIISGSRSVFEYEIPCINSSDPTELSARILTNGRFGRRETQTFPRLFLSCSQRTALCELINGCEVIASSENEAVNENENENEAENEAVNGNENEAVNENENENENNNLILYVVLGLSLLVLVVFVLYVVFDKKKEEEIERKRKEIEEQKRKEIEEQKRKEIEEQKRNEETENSNKNLKTILDVDSENNHIKSNRNINAPVSQIWSKTRGLHLIFKQNDTIIEHSIRESEIFIGYLELTAKHDAKTTVDGADPGKTVVEMDFDQPDPGKTVGSNPGKTVVEMDFDQPDPRKTVVEMDFDEPNSRKTVFQPDYDEQNIAVLSIGEKGISIQKVDDLSVNITPMTGYDIEIDGKPLVETTRVYVGSSILFDDGSEVEIRSLGENYETSFNPDHRRREHTLVLQGENNALPRKFSVANEPLFIGRESKPGQNNIQIKLSKISREHAFFWASGGFLFTKELGATNPIRINKIPLKKNIPTQISRDLSFRLCENGFYKLE